MSDFSSIPEDLQPLVQSLTADCTAKERRAVIKQFSSVCPWNEPLMPILISCLVANKKGTSTVNQMEEAAALLAEQQEAFITTIEARNELISTEARAMDQSLKNANEDFSRKLVTLSDRVESSIETIAKTQSQLIQMHQQLAIRTRQNMQGKLQTYGVGALVGFAITLLVQTL